MLVGVFGVLVGVGVGASIVLVGVGVGASIVLVDVGVGVSSVFVGVGVTGLSLYCRASAVGVNSIGWRWSSDFQCVCGCRCWNVQSYLLDPRCWSLYCIGGRRCIWFNCKGVTGVFVGFVLCQCRRYRCSSLE